MKAFMMKFHRESINAHKNPTKKLSGLMCGNTNIELSDHQIEKIVRQEKEERKERRRKAEERAKKERELTAKILKREEEVLDDVMDKIYDNIQTETRVTKAVLGTASMRSDTSLDKDSE